MKRLTAALGAIVLCCTGFGCNSNPNADDLTGDFRLDAVLVVDLQRDTVMVAVDLRRDGAKVTSAAMSMGGKTLTFDVPSFAVDSVYSLQDDSAGAYLGQTFSVIVSDSGRSIDTVAFVVPDTFYIPYDGITIPANHLLQGGGNVTLGWTGSTGSNGYILAAVLSDTAYTGWGYSQINDPNAGTGGTIPGAAFILTDGVTTDTGLYNIHVYAINNSPDSALSDLLLPVQLPDVLADNIAGPQLTGRYGSVVVSARDTVRVVSQTK
jgi:hypothetical protein